MTTTDSIAEETTALQHTRAILLIQEHAERIGLPLPHIVTLDDYDVRIHVKTLADLTDWAKWMETTVTSEHYGADSVHYCCKGLALDHPLQVFYIEAGSR